MFYMRLYNPILEGGKGYKTRCVFPVLPKTFKTIVSRAHRSQPIELFYQPLGKTHIFLDPSD